MPYKIVCPLFNVLRLFADDTAVVVSRFLLQNLEILLKSKIFKVNT